MLPRPFQLLYQTGAEPGLLWHVHFGIPLHLQSSVRTWLRVKKIAIRNRITLCLNLKVTVNIPLRSFSLQLPSEQSAVVDLYSEVYLRGTRFSLQFSLPDQQMASSQRNRPCFQEPSAPVRLLFDCLGLTLLIISNNNMPIISSDCRDGSAGSDDWTQKQQPKKILKPIGIVGFRLA